MIGLIGGSVLTRLLRHPDSQSFAITVLVRTEDNAVKLGKVGVKTIVGSYDDDDLTFLTNAAAEADVVIETVGPFRRSGCFLNSDTLSV